MDQLRPESLDWALTHILRFGDTDIFPIPFEYEAISHCWSGIRDKLISIDLTTYESRSLRRFLVPKPDNAYRVAIQLDPIDTLIYTALVYEAAEMLENQRIPLDRKIACSYRLQIDAKGQFFRAKNGWDDFHEKSQELAKSGNYKYVVVADIADFYNQISHHRVRNSLEVSGVSPVRAENLENFLMNLTGGQSRGIPVGPSASILLAEACLSDVDSFLMRKGYIHTRYVDDYRIFCSSRSKAFQALHDLSDYTYTSHRLAIQSSKTRIIPIDEFLIEELLDPERLEEQKKVARITEILMMFSDYGGYEETAESDLSQEALHEIVKENLVDLFDICLTKKPLQLGLARHLLRRATILRTAVLQDRVLGHLDTLTPVMRDAAAYILKTIQTKSSTKVGEAIIFFLESSDLSVIPFVHLWSIHILLEKFASDFEPRVSKLCEAARDQLGNRYFALLARYLKYIDWVRSQKETWQNNSPWDRRAIIWASAILPDDERKHWLKRIQNSGDILDNAIAKVAMSGA